MSHDLFSFGSPGMFGGLRVVESPNRPRYVLPPEVCPGVPWPKGFREEINQWSREFLGTTNIIPRGTAYVIGGNLALMRPEMSAMLINLAC